MILRRVMEHVRDQNWAAVGIDFCIVVIGVFFGIQVANWNDARAEERRGSAYAGRLAPPAPGRGPSTLPEWAFR